MGGQRSASTSGAFAERALIAAVENYVELDQTEWKARGSTAHQVEEHVRTSRGVSPATPINESVLDFLHAVDKGIGSLEQRVRARHAMPAAGVCKTKAERTVDAMRRLACEADDLDPKTLTDVLKVASDVLDRSAKLLGLKPTVHAMAECPLCDCRSVIVDPHNRDRAFCANRQCRDENGERPEWSYADGSWYSLTIPATPSQRDVPAVEKRSRRMKGSAALVAALAGGPGLHAVLTMPLIVHTFFHHVASLPLVS